MLQSYIFLSFHISPLSCTPTAHTFVASLKTTTHSSTFQLQNHNDVPDGGKVGDGSEAKKKKAEEGAIDFFVFADRLAYSSLWLLLPSAYSVYLSRPDVSTLPAPNSSTTWVILLRFWFLPSAPSVCHYDAHSWILFNFNQFTRSRPLSFCWRLASMKECRCIATSETRTYLHASAHIYTQHISTLM